MKNYTITYTENGTQYAEFNLSKKELYKKIKRLNKIASRYSVFDFNNYKIIKYDPICFD